MEAVQEKVLDKVRKLLALADENGGGTEAERELAMERAQAILFEHELTMMDITPEAERSGVIEDTEDWQMRDRWKGRLLYFIGEGVGCKGLFTTPIPGKRVSRWHLIGPEDRVAFARTLRDWLVPYLEREYEAAYARDYAVGWDMKGPDRRVYKREFMDAAMVRISDRLKEKEREQEVQHGSVGTELVRSHKRAVDTYMGEHYPRLRTSRSQGQRHGGARSAGSDAGSRADLSPSSRISGGQAAIGAGA